MIDNFYLPTRIISGVAALSTIAKEAERLKMRSVLLVSDPTVSRQTYYAGILQQLEGAGLRVQCYNECEIDARVRQIDDQGMRARNDKIDGVISIGGGSVMCAGKGMAIVAANATSIRECTGTATLENRPLPTIMVPTTAGSGSEVSQWTVVKDDETKTKFVCGGPLCFPDVAILDPIVLESLPGPIGAATGVDALTHAIEAYTSRFSSPISDALALEAVRMLCGSLRRSISLEGDVEAKLMNLRASTLANMACGHARLGHAHTLSLALESLVDMPHTLGVGVLLPRVLAFNLVVVPEKAFRLAAALGVETASGGVVQDIIPPCIAALEALYLDIGFPFYWTDRQLPSARVREIAERSVSGLYGGYREVGNVAADPIADDSIIVSAAPRKLTVSQAEDILTECVRH
jgi:alcohol dehydrogenase class IV